MEILAYTLPYLWSQWIYPILMFALGIGLVIFVHELGHLLAAKAVGIQVQRFAIGFGPRLFGVKIGETDYCLSAFPLGGYVKMLGQEDFSRAEEPQGPLDPRSYAAKSIGARFVVIAAGVVMNVIFAAILFIVIGLVGKEFLAPVVGDVIRGFPAAEAGLKPGDRILSMRGDSWVLNMVGRRVTRFQDVSLIAMLADRDDEFKFAIEREVDGQARTIHTTVGVKENADQKGVLAFGIHSASSTVLGIKEGLHVDVPFRKGDRLTAVNGKTFGHAWEIRPFLEALDGRPVTLTVERVEGQSTATREIVLQPRLGLTSRVVCLRDGRLLRTKQVRPKDDNNEEEKTRFDVELEDGQKLTVAKDDIRPVRLDVLGMQPRLRVAAVEKRSPADRAGIRPGDVILAYGDDLLPIWDEFRRITAAVVNQATKITVLRGQKEFALEVTPRSGEERPVIGVYVDPDLAHCVVADVRKGSAAEKAGILSGATITAVSGQPVGSWQELYLALQARSGKSVELAFQYGSSQRVAKIGKLTAKLFDPRDYGWDLLPRGMGFEPLMARIVKKNPGAAVAWGCEETATWILTTYMSFRGLARRTVPVDSVSGPVGIGGLAIQAARRGFMHFVYLFALISAVIAVFNFLPLPVFDGGHAVLLILEKIRRKPLSARAMNVIQTVGLLLIVALFIALTFKDIRNLISR